MVLDSIREVDATRFQHLVQWSDDKSLSRDSWELQEDLSVIPETSNPELYFEIKVVRGRGFSSVPAAQPPDNLISCCPSQTGGEHWDS